MLDDILMKRVFGMVRMKGTPERILMLKDLQATERKLLTNKTLLDFAKCDHAWLSVSQTNIPEIDITQNLF